MPSFEPEDILLERRRGGAHSLSPILLSDGYYRSFSYCKLPEQLLKLSILKLDGSCFEVHVARSATVAELKEAVEEVFSLSPKEGQGKISWSHVWGHFCLCFDGQKLLNDKALIRNFGIKDGDQLKFIRHMSINHNPVERQSKNRNVARKRYSLPSSGSNDQEEEDQSFADEKFTNEYEDAQFNNYNYDDQEEDSMPEFKLANFLRGWLSYSRLWGFSRKQSEGKTRPSRFARHCLGGGPRMIQL